MSTNLCGKSCDGIDWRARAEAAEKDAARYRWLCATLGVTQLPTLIERITNGYVADYKPSIDAAIDAAMEREKNSPPPFPRGN